MPEIIDLSMPVHMWMERYPGHAAARHPDDRDDVRVRGAHRHRQDGLPRAVRPQRVHLQRALRQPTSTREATAE